MGLKREKTRASREDRTLSDQGIEPTTNRTHMWNQRRWDLNHIFLGGGAGGRGEGGVRVLSLLPHPCTRGCTKLG